MKNTAIPRQPVFALDCGEGGAEHSSDCVVSKIVEETFGAAGTFTIASGNFSVSLND